MQSFNLKDIIKQKKSKVSKKQLREHLASNPYNQVLHRYNKDKEDKRRLLFIYDWQSFVNPPLQDFDDGIKELSSIKIKDKPRKKKKAEKAIAFNTAKEVGTKENGGKGTKDNGKGVKDNGKGLKDNGEGKRVKGRRVKENGEGKKVKAKKDRAKSSKSTKRAPSLKQEKKKKNKSLNLAVVEFAAPAHWNQMTNVSVQPADSFTRWINNVDPRYDIKEGHKQKKTKKSSKKKAKKSNPIKSKIDASVQSKDQIVSEHLAKLYMDQGYYTKALDMYERLSLKNPEKSHFFAPLIEELKSKI